MGLHRPRVQDRREKIAKYVLTFVVIAFMVLASWFALGDDDQSNYQVQMTQQERDYIYELEQSTDISLAPQEILVALDIADKHIGHGHLNGMRIPMASDFRTGIPRIPEDKIDDAVQVLEHHFKAVTGKEQ